MVAVLQGCSLSLFLGTKARYQHSRSSEVNGNQWTEQVVIAWVPNSGVALSIHCCLCVSGSPLVLCLPALNPLTDQPWSQFATLELPLRASQMYYRTL